MFETGFLITIVILLIVSFGAAYLGSRLEE